MTEDSSLCELPAIISQKQQKDGSRHRHLPSVSGPFSLERDYAVFHRSLTKNSLHCRENSYHLLHLHPTGNILRVFVCLSWGERTQASPQFTVQVDSASGSPMLGLPAWSLSPTYSEISRHYRSGNQFMRQDKLPHTRQRDRHTFTPANKQGGN